MMMMKCYHCGVDFTRYGYRCSCGDDIFSGRRFAVWPASAPAPVLRWCLYFSFGRKVVLLEGGDNRRCWFALQSTGRGRNLPRLLSDAVSAAADVEAWATVRDIVTQELKECGVLACYLEDTQR